MAKAELSMIVRARGMTQVSRNTSLIRTDELTIKSTGCRASIIVPRPAMTIWLSAQAAPALVEAKALKPALARRIALPPSHGLGIQKQPEA